MSDTPSPSKIVPWVVAGLVLAALVWLGVWAWPWIWQVFHDPQAFRDWLKQWGPWSPAVFVALQTLQVVIFAIPGEVTQIAAGWLFGFGLGSLLSLLGIIIGSAIAFGLTRWLGAAFVHRIAGPEAVAKFDGLMASPKFIGSLFLLFLIPGIPKDILCYVAGLSRLKFFPFLAISGLARLPGIFGSSLMGKAVFERDWWLLGGVAVAALVLFGLGWLLREPIFRWVERFAVQKEESKETPQ
jgi:uncharacterized membrane protein YdjX (TVP38/TMEM64 family)